MAACLPAGLITGVAGAAGGGDGRWEDGTHPCTGPLTPVRTGRHCLKRAPDAITAQLGGPQENPADPGWGPEPAFLECSHECCCLATFTFHCFLASYFLLFVFHPLPYRSRQVPLCCAP